MVEIFKALSDLCRVRLMGILFSGEFTVQELTAIIGTGQSRISHHLKTLTDAGLVKLKRQGTWSYYSVNENNDFFAAIRPFFIQHLDSLPERPIDFAAVARLFEQRRKRNLEFFDRHARQWDSLVQALLPLPDYRQNLLNLLPAGGSFLEIGVGTGGLLLDLAQIGSNVIGVDHSPAMLAEARCRVAHACVNGVELRLGEMAHLPLPDSTVDCVVANMVLHHAADPKAVIAEIRRVLIVGGQLLIADLARHEREAARDQLADQWLGFEADELAGWLCEAGFSHVFSEKIVGCAGQETVLLFSSR